MIALVEVEVRRLWARRLTHTLVVALFVGIVAAPPLVDWAFRERARIERDADLESVLSTNFKPLRPWLVLNNAIVFVKGQFEGGPRGDVPGRTVAAAGLVLVSYLTALLVVTACLFRRRDVT